jgi:anti-sigma B factor antagonist
MDIFQSTSDSGILTLTVSGRIDADTTGAFSETIDRCIEAGNHKIVLDLSGVDYVTSVGLRALILGAKRLAPLGGKMVLCAPQERVLKLLELAGFTSIFKIAGNREQAEELLR